MFRLFIVLGALFVQTAVAAACSCARPTLDELIESSKDDLAIFSARVVSVLSPQKGKPAVTRLYVDEVIKGEVPRVIEMTGVTPEDAPCGVDFRPGEVRIVAAYKKDGRWFTDLCLMPRL
jgi:hypothetical protein